MGTNSSAKAVLTLDKSSTQRPALVSKLRSSLRHLMSSLNSSHSEVREDDEAESSEEQPSPVTDAMVEAATSVLDVSESISGAVVMGERGYIERLTSVLTESCCGDAESCTVGSRRHVSQKAFHLSACILSAFAKMCSHFAILQRTSRSKEACFFTQENCEACRYRSPQPLFHALGNISGRIELAETKKDSSSWRAFAANSALLRALSGCSSSALECDGKSLRHMFTECGMHGLLAFALSRMQPAKRDARVALASFSEVELTELLNARPESDESGAAVSCLGHNRRL